MTPLYAQNQIIITPSVHYIDRLRSIFLSSKLTNAKPLLAPVSLYLPTYTLTTRRKGL